MADHVLARRDGVGLVFALLVLQGAACPKCGHGTRATSKRWARCKACGHRVERRPLPRVTEHRDGHGVTVTAACGCKSVRRGRHVRRIFCDEHGAAFPGGSDA